MLSKLCKTAEMANQTGIPAHRLLDLARQGLIPHVRAGRQVYYSPEAIERWIEGGGQAHQGGWRKEAK